mmetsp:Transcript_6188/g.9736  ORF Transcript_6188/g.9736 Transcript_6188/m.9736 type:complete len:377 (-) Transcript_6188:120-1250(-)|eukprot:CAMPEP_0203749046 /NCGR_PEP_ID=MMETSP0098-20131031/3740_1 /ASSEMBLY_ACC=CAM_ASM_000208 /TAXON_ID=96639 /ORGANISM=" , Strain NY0313808BC1" /LENGTH=376 /DNA_ID=CAMNT_0050637977 /DNA_START=304 /DNA_END=1434 /DNA_ORIENTATION=-
MGLCGSSMSAEEKKEAAQNKALEAAARKEQAQESQKLKLLLLGAGESGKSTLFKQMKLLFSEQHGFTQSEIQANVKVVYNNIVSNMKILLTNCENFTPAQDTALADELLGLEEGVVIDAALGDKLKEIWADKGVQDTWLQRSNFQVQDALEYFMENIDRIKQDDFLPANQDILRSRVRTSGIVEAEYNINGVRVAMFDVGGQRNERKKWIHCFDNVTAVIFVAAISEYDQTLYEDMTTNRQEEALTLFSEMCESTWFRNKSMILFLNKKDVFRKKLAYVPFKVESGENMRNVDYNGPEAVPGTPSAEDGTPEFEAVYQAATAYLIELYKTHGKRTNPKREIYVKVTSATDSDQVKVVMESCKDIILKNNLTENGFM